MDVRNPGAFKPATFHSGLNRGLPRQLLVGVSPLMVSRVQSGLKEFGLYGHGSAESIYKYKMLVCLSVRFGAYYKSL